MVLYPVFVINVKTKNCLRMQKESLSEHLDSSLDYKIGVTPIPT